MSGFAPFTALRKLRDSFVAKADVDYEKAMYDYVYAKFGNDIKLDALFGTHTTLRKVGPLYNQLLNDNPAAAELFYETVTKVTNDIVALAHA